MSLQFNNRRRRRRRRLKREVIITIRVLLAVLVLGLFVYGSINVYSYFSNKNKNTIGEEEKTGKLPIEPDTDKEPVDDNSNTSSDILDDNNNKEDEVLDNKDNTEQNIEDKDKPDTDKPDTDKPDIDKPDTDKPDTDKPDTDKSENDETDNNVVDNNKPGKDQTQESGLKDKDNSKGDIKNDESYFDDAVFIGDSRTEGLKLYSGLKNATFYAEKGLDISTIYKNKIKINGSDMTILDALNKNSFGKVYINFGVNELGWPYDSEFIKQYGKLIDAVKKAQPDAVIYLQSIIRVTSEKEKNPPQYINNKTINKRNKLLKELANEKGIYYIDANEVLSDKNGYLIAEASVDGVHLNKKYCEVWKKFLIDNIKK